MGWLAENSTVAVFGIGCVGLSILQGARAKGCKRVFAIDTNPSKEEWAKKFGASTSNHVPIHQDEEIYLI
jgi:Zn-dependent alcohol dehydrogenase